LPNVEIDGQDVPEVDVRIESDPERPGVMVMTRRHPHARPSVEVVQGPIVDRGER
jgi:hypothetical protein